MRCLRKRRTLMEGVRVKIASAFLTGLAASVLIFAFNGDTFAEKFNSLPAAVRDTAEAHMKSALPVSINSVKGEQGWDYQINTRLNGKYHDLVIDENGKLLAVKDEADLSSIPQAARAAIEKQAGASKLVTLEKVTQGQQVGYNAVITDDTQHRNVQVRVGEDGTVQSTSRNDSAK